LQERGGRIVTGEIMHCGRMRTARTWVRPPRCYCCLVDRRQRPGHRHARRVIPQHQATHWLHTPKPPAGLIPLISANAAFALKGAAITCFTFLKIPSKPQRRKGQAAACRLPDARNVREIFCSPQLRQSGPVWEWAASTWRTARCFHGPFRFVTSGNGTMQVSRAIRAWVQYYCALNINADKWPVPPMRKTNKRAISRSFRGCGYNRLRTLCSTPILDGCRLPGRLRQLPCHQARAAIDTGSALMGSGRTNRTARTWQRDCRARRNDVVRTLSGKVDQRMNTRLALIGKSAVQHRLPPRQTRNPIAAACAGNSNHL